MKDTVHPEASAVIRRLNGLCPLSHEAIEALEQVIKNNARRAEARADLVSEGDPPKAVRLILDGWACRYKTLEDGRRQILNFLLPGDACDFHINLLHVMDHSVGALTTTAFAEVPTQVMEDLAAAHPSIAQAMMRGTLVSAAIQREWTMNVGRRAAYERMAHLLCEVYTRLHFVKLTEGHTCSFPVTQADLADATGLSVVHVNRTLQELRGAGLIVLRGKTLAVSDLDALQSAALFTPTYLHLE